MITFYSCFLQSLFECGGGKINFHFLKQSVLVVNYFLIIFYTQHLQQLSSA